MKNKTVTAKFFDSEGDERKIENFIIGFDGTVDSNDFTHSFNDDPSQIVFHYNSKEKSDEYWDNHGKLHRLTGPAIIRYLGDGSIAEKKYYIEGKYMEKSEWEIESNRLQVLNEL